MEDIGRAGQVNIAGREGCALSNTHQALGVEALVIEAAAYTGTGSGVGIVIPEERLACDVDVDNIFFGLEIERIIGCEAGILADGDVAVIVEVADRYGCGNGPFRILPA